LSQCKFEVGDYIDVVINPPDTGIAGGRGNAAHGVYGAQRRSGERVERDRTGSFSGGGGGRYGGFGRWYILIKLNLSLFYFMNKCNQYNFVLLFVNLQAKVIALFLIYSFKLIQFLKL